MSQEWQRRATSKVIDVLLFASVLKMLSTSSLAWVWVCFWFGVASCVSRGYNIRNNPLTLNRRLQEEHQLTLAELANQAETLNEYEWQLKTKEGELDVKASGLMVQTEDYANQLRASAEQQIQALVQDYENKLAHVNQERLLLDSQVSYLLDKIDSLTAPKLPTASDPASLLATQLCKELDALQCPVDYERCWYDSGDIIVWVKPRKGGLKAVAKHLEELQLKLSLISKPIATIINGVVQVVLKPMPYSSGQPEDSPLIELYKTTQAVTDVRQQLMNAWTKEAPPRVVGFIEPLIPIHPAGGLSQLERDWILSCHYKGRAERDVIARVYGCTSSKQTQIYAACKARYDEVMESLQSYE